MKKLVGHKVKLVGNDVESMIPVSAFPGLSAYRRVTEAEGKKMVEDQRTLFVGICERVKGIKNKITSSIEYQLPNDGCGCDMDKVRILLLGVIVLTHDPILAEFELHRMLKVTGVSVQSAVRSAGRESVRVDVMYSLGERPAYKIEGEWCPIVSSMHTAWIEAALSVVEKVSVDILKSLYEWKRSGEKPAAVITEVYEEEKAQRRYENREIGIKKTKNEIKKN